MSGGPQNIVGIVVLAGAALAVLYGLYIRTPNPANAVAGVTPTAGGGVPWSPSGLPPGAGNTQNEFAPAVLLPVAANAGVADVAPNYVGPGIQIYEAHWQGMDTKQFNEEIRRKLKYPRGFNGVLIGEVTMAAADSGLRAGDVIVLLEGVPVTTLEDFQRQTKTLRARRQAAVSVMRKGKQTQDGRFIMSRRTFVLRANDQLGFAQVETAPMIVAGDPPPHPYRGPCTRCHAIGEGFELVPDPDLINLPPPTIAAAVAAQGQPPHRDFGPCEACHVIVQ